MFRVLVNLTGRNVRVVEQHPNEQSEPSGDGVTHPAEGYDRAQVIEPVLDAEIDEVDMKPAHRGPDRQEDPHDPLQTGL